MIRRKTARETLVESFRDLSQHKAVDKISVREIVKNCDYSRATFYREFRDKYDLISWDYAQSLHSIMCKYGRGGLPWSQSLLEGAHFFQDNQDYLVNLLRHTAGRESFERCLIDTNCQELRECIESLSGETIDRETDLYVRLYCSGTVKLCCDWLMGRISTDASSIADVWEKSVPAPLQPYLYGQVASSSASHTFTRDRWESC